MSYPVQFKLFPLQLIDSMIITKKSNHSQFDSNYLSWWIQPTQEKIEVSSRAAQNLKITYLKFSSLKYEHTLRIASIHRNSKYTYTYIDGKR